MLPIQKWCHIHFHIAPWLFSYILFVIVIPLPRSRKRKTTCSTFSSLEIWTYKHLVLASIFSLYQIKGPNISNWLQRNHFLYCFCYIQDFKQNIYQVSQHTRNPPQNKIFTIFDHSNTDFNRKLSQCPQSIHACTWPHIHSCHIYTHHTQIEKWRYVWWWSLWYNIKRNKTKQNSTKQYTIESITGLCRFTKR